MENSMLCFQTNALQNMPITEDVDMAEGGCVVARFKNEAGEEAGAPFELPLDIDTAKLTLLCNSVLNKEEPVPFLFFVKDVQIKGTLGSSLEKGGSTEHVLDITYAEQACFRVRPVTRCTSSIPGHAEAVISAAFSPDGRYLASGSGDTTVRLWDVTTETPQFTCKGHKHWVLCIAWAPNGMKLASGCKNSQIYIWDPETGTQKGRALSGHKGWINSLSWEPLHSGHECRRLASSSKDCSVRVWDTVLGVTLHTLHSHTGSVTCVRWGGSGLIYTAAQDRTLKVFRAEDGVLCRTLSKHSHWVNSIALNVDYVLRTGPFDPSKASVTFRDVTETSEQLARLAKERYQAVVATTGELLVSGSDDLTLVLWKPETSSSPVAHMTGHQGLINDVRYSPDGRLVASASFDKSIKLWDGRTGKFLASLRGHVQRVHVLAWSADSRLLVSGSADSTLKVFDARSAKMAIELPGHADEVYAVDWSPDGQRVVSGGKDKVIKIWRQ